jgi:hypothetical protein
MTVHASQGRTAAFGAVVHLPQKPVRGIAGVALSRSASREDTILHDVPLDGFMKIPLVKLLDVEARSASLRLMAHFEDWLGRFSPSRVEAMLGDVSVLFAATTVEAGFDPFDFEDCVLDREPVLRAHLSGMGRDGGGDEGGAGPPGGKPRGPAKSGKRGKYAGKSARPPPLRACSDKAKRRKTTPPTQKKTPTKTTTRSPPPPPPPVPPTQSGSASDPILEKDDDEDQAVQSVVVGPPPAPYSVQNVGLIDGFMTYRLDPTFLLHLGGFLSSSNVDVVLDAGLELEAAGHESRGLFFLDAWLTGNLLTQLGRSWALAHSSVRLGENVAFLEGSTRTRRNVLERADALDFPLGSPVHFYLPINLNDLHWSGVLVHADSQNV